MNSNDIEAYTRVHRELDKIGDLIAARLSSDIFDYAHELNCDSFEIEEGGVRFNLAFRNDVELWRQVDVLFDVLFSDDPVQAIVDNVKEQRKLEHENAELTQKLTIEREERATLARLKQKYEREA
jgi:hypothetical protein